LRKSLKMSLNKTKCCYSFGPAHGNGLAAATPTRPPPLRPLPSWALPRRADHLRRPRALLTASAPHTLLLSTWRPRADPHFLLRRRPSPVLFFFFSFGSNRRQPHPEPPCATTQLRRRSLTFVGSHDRQPHPHARTTLSFSGREPPPSSTALRSCPSTPSRRPRAPMPSPPQLHSRTSFW
jgi:hypothetical protein